MTLESKMAVPPVVAVDNGLAAKIRGLGEKIDKIARFLEKMYKFDVNGDGKIGHSRIAWLVVLLAVSIVAMATTFVQYQTYDGDAVHGTFKVTDDGAGTATLTVDAAAIAAISPTTIELGHASDTTLSRVSAGVAAVENKNIYVAGGTDVAVADGGTGLGAGTSGGVLAYTATGTLASSALLAQYGIVLGGGAGAAPATLAASANTGAPLLSAGAAANPAYGPLNLAGGATIVTGVTPVANGGTALASGTSGGVLAYTAAGVIASSAALTDNCVVIGGGAGAVPETIAVGANNQVLRGATGAAPAFGALVDADIPDTITASNYALLTQVWGAAGISGAPGATTNNVVTITANDIAGNPVAGLRLLHVWVSDSDVGAASTNNIETLTLSTGTAVSTVTANADYWYVTAAAGTAVATIQGTALGTNYLMVADGSTVSSAAVVFED